MTDSHLCLCGNKVIPDDYKCQKCRDEHNRICDSYRAMRASVSDSTYEEQRDALNNFCAGYNNN